LLNYSNPRRAACHAQTKLIPDKTNNGCGPLLIYFSFFKKLNPGAPLYHLQRFIYSFYLFIFCLGIVASLSPQSSSPTSVRIMGWVGNFIV